MDLEIETALFQCSNGLLIQGSKPSEEYVFNPFDSGIAAEALDLSNMF